MRGLGRILTPKHEPARRYAVGGFLCADLDADRLGFAGWRAAFFLEAVAMAPVVLLCGYLSPFLAFLEQDNLNGYHFYAMLGMGVMSKTATTTLTCHT